MFHAGRPYGLGHPQPAVLIEHGIMRAGHPPPRRLIDALIAASIAMVIIQLRAQTGRDSRLSLDPLHGDLSRIENPHDATAGAVRSVNLRTSLESLMRLVDGRHSVKKGMLV